LRETQKAEEAGILTPVLGDCPSMKPKKSTTNTKIRERREE
jgi:hypothetical protein